MTFLLLLFRSIRFKLLRSAFFPPKMKWITRHCVTVAFQLNSITRFRAHFHGTFTPTLLIRWYVFVFSKLYIFPRVARQKIIKLYPESLQTKNRKKKRREAKKKVIFHKLNSMIHEWDRHIAHDFSWALNEVFYRSSDSCISRETKFSIEVFSEFFKKLFFTRWIFLKRYFFKDIFS